MGRKSRPNSGNLSDYTKNDPSTNALVAATSPVGAMGEGRSFTINPRGRAIGASPDQAVATTFGSDQEDNVR